MYIMYYAGVFRKPEDPYLGLQLAAIHNLHSTQKQELTQLVNWIHKISEIMGIKYPGSAIKSILN